MSFPIYINNNLFNVDSNISILQACEMANIIVPRFCYHERLSVAGNCRMCLVEVDKMPKLQVSCAFSVSPGISIKTNTPAVKKAREGVIEFLLINHPLDCPICDQGGECDLQDQSFIYGGDKSRFREFKRAVEDKNWGPLIKTIMTRCIHCTRCVRFANEIAGTPDLGTSGRGNFLEIGTYISRFFGSELSGNVIDLCPVGALTSKPYAFLSRPWELKNTESIDLFDSIHSNIRIDTRGYEIMRILPRLNESLNEEWISDKVRFGFDGFFVQRLTSPLKKNSKNVLDRISWTDAIDIICEKFSLINKSNKSCFYIGESCDLESLRLVKVFNLLYNSYVLRSSFESFLNVDYEYLYKFNISLKNIYKTDFCLIFGINPKLEGVLLSYHLRKRFLLGNFKIAYVGSQLKLTFPCIHLGNSLSTVVQIVEGTHPICKTLKKSKSSSIIVGKSFLKKFNSLDCNSFLNTLKCNISKNNNSWDEFSFFHHGPNDFSIYALNLSYNRGFKMSSFDFTFILENYKTLNNNILSKFTVFQGHHGCLNAQNADIVLPSSSFVEKSSIYINCEGRFQRSYAAIPVPGYSLESSGVLFSVLDRINYKQTIKDLDSYIKIQSLIPFSLLLINKIYDTSFKMFPVLNNQILINNFYLESSVFDNFYNTDIVTKMSHNMSKCSKDLLNRSPFNF